MCIVFFSPMTPCTGAEPGHATSSGLLPLWSTLQDWQSWSWIAPEFAAGPRLTLAKQSLYSQMQRPGFLPRRRN
jgi:hypothetical protein